MLKLALDISEVIRRLDVKMSRMISALEKGGDAATGRMLDHAKADHGADAHSRQRFVTRSGNLLDNIEGIPTRVFPDRVEGGIQAIPDYALYVEEGHDIARKGSIGKKGKVTFGGIKGTAPAYPFIRPVKDNEEVRRGIISDFVFYLKRAIR